MILFDRQFSGTTPYTRFVENKPFYEAGKYNKKIIERKHVFFLFSSLHPSYFLSCGFSFVLESKSQRTFIFFLHKRNEMEDNPK